MVLAVLVGLLLAIIAWGFAQARRVRPPDHTLRSHDGLLVGLLTLAACALGVFLTYVLFGRAG